MEKNNKLRKGFAPIFIILIIILGIGGIGGTYGAVEYHKTSKLVKEAEQLTREEKYDEANGKLELVQKNWLTKNLGVKKQEIAGEIEENKKLLEDKSEYAQGIEEFNKGNWEKAKELLSKVSEISPYYREAKNNLEEIQIRITEKPPEEIVKPICKDECFPIGLKKCIDNGYQTCGNYDEDSCLEWSSIINCPTNSACKNGNCVSVPIGRCTSGSCCNTLTHTFIPFAYTNICERVATEYNCPWGGEAGSDVGVRNQYRYCSGFSADCNGPLEWTDWSVDEDCPPNKACINGACVYLTCSDDTLYGECSENRPKYCENGNLIDKASLCGCFTGYEVSGNRCTKTKQIVLLIIDEYLYEDDEIKSKINRYKKDNEDFEFKEILFNKTNNEIKSMEDMGGDIKHNSLELRNTIKQLYYSSDKKVVGLWIIGNIRPTIWRNANFWWKLGQSGFYPSVYPLVAIDKDYYDKFDVANDGFYEKEGVTTGIEVGGGYDATIWGAVLIPSTFDKQKGKELIKNYFDKDHDYYLGSLKFDKKLLYSDTLSGCSQKSIEAISNNPKWQTQFLCPNFQDQLQGFTSHYGVTIYEKGPQIPRFQPGHMGIEVETDEEQKEYNSWIKKDYFGDSWITDYKQPPYEELPDDYMFDLYLKGRSLSTEEIKNKIRENLPRKICSRTKHSSCDVYVEELGFVEDDRSWEGNWTSYSTQRENWKSLYIDLLKRNNFEIIYVCGHGAVTGHDFGINSDLVKNSRFNSMIYEIEACSTGDYSENDYIAGTYLFNSNTLIVSAYAQPALIQGSIGEKDHTRFLKIGNRTPIIDSLFQKNYSISLYFGDPLLKINF